MWLHPTLQTQEQQEIQETGGGGGGGGGVEEVAGIYTVITLPNTGILWLVIEEPCKPYLLHLTRRHCVIPEDMPEGPGISETIIVYT